MNQWFYAREGRQQGPITLEELRGLIRSGILNPATDLVWNPTMTDWVRASQVAELSTSESLERPAAPSDPTNPYSAPTSTWLEPSPAEGLPEIPPGSEQVMATACIKRGFNLNIRHFWMLLSIVVVYLAISFAASIALHQMDVAMGWVTPSQPPPVIPPGTDFAEAFQIGFEASYVQNSGSLLNMLLSSILSVFLILGLTQVSLNVVSGEYFSVGMLFGGGKMLFKGIIAYLIFSVAMMIGFVLLIAPGFYVIARYGHFMNAMVDRNLGPIECFKYSSAITQNNRMNLFLVTLLSIAVMLAGCLALCIGMFVISFPTIMLTWAVAYRWLQYGPRAAMDHHATQQPMLTKLPG